MLTQEEADYLISIDKIIENPKKVKFPLPGEQKEYVVHSGDKKEKFLLDINRGYIKLSKCTYQNRYRRDIVLLRLDIDGRPHTNPSELGGETIECPQLHIFKEGYADRYAIPLPNEFSVDEDIITKFFEFMEFCKIDNANDVHIQGVI